MRYLFALCLLTLCACTTQHKYMVMCSVPGGDTVTANVEDAHLSAQQTLWIFPTARGTVYQSVNNCVVMQDPSNE